MTYNKEIWVFGKNISGCSLLTCTLVFLGEGECKLTAPIYIFLLSISDAHI